MLLHKEVVPFECLEEPLGFLEDICSAGDPILRLFEIRLDIVKLIFSFKFRILEFREFP